MVVAASTVAGITTAVTISGGALDYLKFIHVNMDRQVKFLMDVFSGFTDIGEDYMESIIDTMVTPILLAINSIFSEDGDIGGFVQDAYEIVEGFFVGFLDIMEDNIDAWKELWDILNIEGQLASLREAWEELMPLLQPFVEMLGGVFALAIGVAGVYVIALASAILFMVEGVIRLTTAFLEFYDMIENFVIGDTGSGGIVGGARNFLGI